MRRWSLRPQARPLPDGTTFPRSSHQRMGFQGEGTSFPLVFFPLFLQRNRAPPGRAPFLAVPTAWAKNHNSPRPGRPPRQKTTALPQHTAELFPVFSKHFGEERLGPLLPGMAENLRRGILLHDFPIGHKECRTACRPEWWSRCGRCRESGRAPASSQP